MKKLLLTFILFALATIGFAQETPVEGDYRSVNSGNWSNAGTWQVRDAAGVWGLAATAPTIANNVYIQGTHNITLTTTVSCNDFQIARNGVLTMQTFDLNINGKLRCFNGSAVTTTSDDNLYTNFNLRPSQTTLPATMITSTGNVSFLRFVGNTRTVLPLDCWAGTIQGFGIDFALNSEQIGSFDASIRGRSITISSGIANITTNSAFFPGTGTGVGSFTIKSGATYKTARPSAISGNGLRIANITIENGGTLEVTDDNPAVEASAFTNNGTIVYSGGANQNFLKNTQASTASPVSYNNLTITSTGTATLQASKNVTVSGTLTMTSGKLAIPATSTLELTNGDIAVVGGNATSYIQTLADGVGSGGILKVTGLSTPKTFPTGGSNNYLPVTLSPAAGSNFSINTFSGATQDATPNGTAIADKTSIVDAIYNINRTSGTGTCDVTLGWDASLEGSTFPDVADNQIGAAQYIAAAYGPFTGNGNNTTNSIALTGIATFEPFLIGKNGVLPVSLTTFSAQKETTGIQLRWNTVSEQDNSHFEVQRSSDGLRFSAIGKVDGSGNSNVSLNYSFTDKNPFAGVNYYRLNQVDFDGKATLSKVVFANMGFDNSSLQIFSPVNSTNLNIRIVAEEASAGTLVIYNLNGQKVFSQTISVNKGDNDITINLSTTVNGILVATYDNGVQIHRKKFVK